MAVRPSPRRGVAALALLALVLLPGAAGAQAPPGAPGAAPLRDEPGDWWGDVHRWTGSDATRPRRGTEQPALRAAPSAGERAPAVSPGDGARVTTSTTARSNIRREPSTSAPVLRVVRPGTTLRVFSEAPGGWLQVGEGEEPIGWIHQSTLRTR